MAALGGIYAALKALIAADSGVAALIANAPAGKGGGKAIYDDGDAPQASSVQPFSTLSPYLTIGAGTEIAFSTFRKRGWNCTVQVKVVWSGAESTGIAIANALSTLLFQDGGPTTLTVSGFASSWVDDFSLQPTLVTTVAGVVTRELPVIVRVIAT